MTDLPVVIVCSNEHLERVFDRVQELLILAEQGDRHAEKQLKFAERYGMSPVASPFTPQEAERRIKEFYGDD